MFAPLGISTCPKRGNAFIKLSVALHLSLRVALLNTINILDVCCKLHLNLILCNFAIYNSIIGNGIPACSWLAFANQQNMNITKNRYLQGFGVTVIVLACLRCAFPTIAEGNSAGEQPSDKQNAASDTIVAPADAGMPEEIGYNADGEGKRSRFFMPDGSLVKSRIYSVSNFGKAFPDQNDVQLVAAQRNGVKPVADRNDAELRKSELVYVGCNPFFYVDKLKSSIPYLVPKASVLLQDIGRNFFDSLQVKRIPLHKIIVTSVLRSRADIDQLRGHNGNATQNSCHLYGTTFDVCYNRYKTVEAPDGKPRRKVSNDTLKWVLSEVLNDMRLQNRCLVKYEVHQGCFHITVN